MFQYKYMVATALSVTMLSILPVYADMTSLDDALRATYNACVGIDDELHDLKTMAGINTAVTAIGTATGAGATAVGIVKASKDKQAEELERLIKELRELEKGKQEPTEDQKNSFLTRFGQSYASAIKELDGKESELDKLNKQSKKLGNWRTGLIAGSTVTNVAGAIIAGTGQSTGDLQVMIDNCRSALGVLRQTMGQAQINGEDVSEARDILTACEDFNYVDVSKISKRGKGAMVSSIVGSATGAAGTITSAVANSNNIREDNSDTGKKKEKNLNTAANVLSGATTAASATATVFNATQISAIKKVASVAEKCTGVLK